MGTYGQARFGGPKPIIIADTHTINIFEPFLGFRGNQFIEPFRAVFLHPLETHDEVHRDIDPSLLVSFNHIEPAQNGAFIVC
jgi:hypothetical protein